MRPEKALSPSARMSPPVCSIPESILLPGVSHFPRRCTATPTIWIRCKIAGRNASANLANFALAHSAAKAYCARSFVPTRDKVHFRRESRWSQGSGRNMHHDADLDLLWYWPPVAFNRGSHLLQDLVGFSPFGKYRDHPKHDLDGDRSGPPHKSPQSCLEERRLVQIQANPSPTQSSRTGFVAVGALPLVWMLLRMGAGCGRLNALISLFAQPCGIRDPGSCRYTRCSSGTSRSSPCATGWQHSSPTSRTLGSASCDTSTGKIT